MVLTRWALFFLLTALIGAAVGFAEVPATVAGVARVVAWIFAVLCAGTVVLAAWRCRPPRMV